MDNSALCVTTADTRARISALLIDARKVRVALGIDHALGSAIWWRSYVLGLARAHCLAVHVLALTVWTAGRWIAHVTFVEVICKRLIPDVDASELIYYCNAAMRDMSLPREVTLSTYL